VKKLRKKYHEKPESISRREIRKLEKYIKLKQQNVEKLVAPSKEDKKQLLKARLLRQKIDNIQEDDEMNKVEVADR